LCLGDICAKHGEDCAVAAQEPGNRTLSSSGASAGLLAELIANNNLAQIRKPDLVIPCGGSYEPPEPPLVTGLDSDNTNNARDIKCG